MRSWRRRRRGKCGPRNAGTGRGRSGHDRRRCKRWSAGSTSHSSRRGAIRKKFLIIGSLQNGKIHLSTTENHLKSAAEKDTPSHCSRYSVPEKENSEKCFAHKRHSFKQVARNQAKSFEDPPPRNKGPFVSERVSRYEAEQKLKAIQTKQEQVRKRRLEIVHKREELLKRSAEEFREKLKQVKMNQAELDKAMEKWQSQVISYQEEANLRAQEKVAQELQQRRLKAMHDRLSKQEEHKRNMQKIEAEEYAKLQEMMAKLRSKDERCRVFKEEKNSSIEQSRQLAQAASDLRDLIRQRLDKDSFVRKSQQAAMESRLLNIEPRTATRLKKQNNPPTTPEDDA